MRPTPLAGGLALASLFAQSGATFWRQPCKNTLVTERLDPIVSPGQTPSSHTHTFCGGSNLMPATNTSWQQASDCTSAGVTEDKSLYWTPNLFWQWKNGSFTSVTGDHTVYYEVGDTTKTPVTAFPDDFRMLFGDPYRLSVNSSDVGQNGMKFLCLQTDRPGTDEQSAEALTWPTTDDCSLGMRAQFSFPRCWDGKNVDTPNHADHMSFPTNGIGGDQCPSTHPVLMPRIFIEIYFQWNDFKGRWNEAANSQQPFVWANGNKAATGFHGDFLNGWQAGVLQKAIDGCNNGIGGTVEANCAGILTVPTEECRITPHLDEQTTGLLTALPGCQQIFDATTGKKTADPSCPKPQVLSPITAYQGSAPPAGACTLSGGSQVKLQIDDYAYGGCLAYTGGRLLTTQLTSKATPEDCVAACKAGNFKFCGLEYGKECWASNSLATLPTSDDGGCSMPCEGDATAMCGGASHDTLYVQGGTPSSTAGTCSRADGSTASAAAPAAAGSQAVVASAVGSNAAVAPLSAASTAASPSTVPQASGAAEASASVKQPATLLVAPSGRGHRVGGMHRHHSRNRGARLA